MKIMGEIKVNNATKKHKTNIMIACIALLLFVVTLSGTALSLYAKNMIKKIPALSFDEALAYTLKDNEEALITVGIVKGGQHSFMVYGNNGEVLSSQSHTYEIGSLTKTFTAALIAKDVQEGRLALEDTIDMHLSLPKGTVYPTIAELLTHTSSYKPYYFEWPMVGNFLTRKNDFYGITKDMVKKKISSLHDSDTSHAFEYSNFGYAVLGLILEEIHDHTYAFLVDEFIQHELHLQNTRITDRQGDLSNYWDWNVDDAYLPAGGIVSNIDDMLEYAHMLLDDERFSMMFSKPIKKINATSNRYEMLDIHMDFIGMAWIFDEQNDIIWHNGGTGHYNSYLGFDGESKTAVVILSNLSPDTRLPSTVLGVKLMKELRK